MIPRFRAFILISSVWFWTGIYGPKPVGPPNRTRIEKMRILRMNRIRSPNLGLPKSGKSRTNWRSMDYGPLVIFEMVITYGAQDCARGHMYQSTQSGPKLCFILVPNSSKLQHCIPLKKSWKPWTTLVMMEYSCEVLSNGILIFESWLF